MAGRIAEKSYPTMRMLGDLVSRDYSRCRLAVSPLTHILTQSLDAPFPELKSIWPDVEAALIGLSEADRFSLLSSHFGFSFQVVPEVDLAGLMTLLRIHVHRMFGTRDVMFESSISDLNQGGEGTRIRSWRWEFVQSHPLGSVAPIDPRHLALNERIENLSDLFPFTVGMDFASYVVMLANHYKLNCVTDYNDELTDDRLQQHGTLLDLGIDGETDRSGRSFCVSHLPNWRIPSITTLDASKVHERVAIRRVFRG